LHDLLVQLCVLLIQSSVVLHEVLVGSSDLGKLVGVLGVSGLKLRVLDLHAQKLLSVFVALLLDSLGFFNEDFHILLELNLGVKLLSSKAFLNLELLEHSLGLLVLELEGELESGDLFALSLKLETLLVSFCNASTLEFVFHFQVLFVNFALLGQNLKNLGVGNIALPL
jgi:hypothetical protein